MRSTSAQNDVDDARERDLPEVDLFFQDEVQEEVERALENRRRDLVRHAAQGTRAAVTGLWYRRADRPKSTPGDRRARR